MVVGAASGGVGAASLGPVAVFSLFGWPSCGLGRVDVLAQDPPMVAVVVWRASGSWCRLGSSLLNDNAMRPPQPVNRLDLPWRSSLTRLVLGARLGIH